MESFSFVLNAIWWNYRGNAFWNQIEETEMTGQIYTDSSVMILTPCGIYWKLGFKKLCFLTQLEEKEKFIMVICALKVHFSLFKCFEVH